MPIPRTLKIPVYYTLDDDGQILIDEQSMEEDFIMQKAGLTNKYNGTEEGT